LYGRALHVRASYPRYIPSATEHAGAGASFAIVAGIILLFGFLAANFKQ
jgi:hypothetical protein